MKKAMSKAPMAQKMPMTPKSAKEVKTARPAKGRNMNTPRVKEPAAPPMKKKAPKY